MTARVKKEKKYLCLQLHLRKSLSFTPPGEIVNVNSVNMLTYFQLPTSRRLNSYVTYSVYTKQTKSLRRIGSLVTRWNCLYAYMLFFKLHGSSVRTFPLKTKRLRSKKENMSVVSASVNVDVDSMTAAMSEVVTIRSRIAVVWYCSKRVACSFYVSLPAVIIRSMILASVHDFVFASVWSCVDRWFKEKGCGVCVDIVVASIYSCQCVYGFVQFEDILIRFLLGSSAVACVTACCV